MLNPEYIDAIPHTLSRLFMSAEADILIGIAERIALKGYITNSSLYQLQRLSELRQFDIDFKKILAELTELSDKEIDKIFKEAGETAHNYDKRLFEAKGIPFIPYEHNTELQSIVALTAEQTKQTFKNFTNSSALNMVVDGVAKPLTQAYINILDNATNKVLSGLESYDSAIKQAVNQMANSGITVVNYESGRNERIEGVVRRNLLSSISNMANIISDMNAESLGTTIFEISWHKGNRPNHGWGGQRFDTTGKDYPTEQQLAEKYAVDGKLGFLSDPNCRHSKSPAFKDIPPTYTQEQLNEMNKKDKETKPYQFKNRKGETYQKDMTLRDQLDYQRYMERTMRDTRRKAAMFKVVGDDERYTTLKARYQSQKTKYSEFSNIMGIKPDWNRVYLDGLGRV